MTELEHRDYFNLDIPNYLEIVTLYNSVKEDIKFGFPAPWTTPAHTMQMGIGNCGMKSEVLVHVLRSRGFTVRFVEGRHTHINSTWIKKALCALGLVLFDAHIWVEVSTPVGWLALDPSPDRGIVRCFGNTKPGTHLGNPEQIYYHDKLPAWQKEVYNMRLFSPLRLIAGLEIWIRRLLGQKRARGIHEHSQF